jgi:FG-GAP repeat
VPRNPILAPRTRASRGRLVAALRPSGAAALALLLVLALASPASALEQQISFSGNDSLGFSVAVQGDTLVLGTLQPNDVGVVYVYQRAGDSWEQTAKLTASNSTPGDLFGASVAIDGDTILVGAPGATIGKNANQGAVYSFSRTGPATRTEPPS